MGWHWAGLGYVSASSTTSTFKGQQQILLTWIACHESASSTPSCCFQPTADNSCLSFVNQTQINDPRHPPAQTKGDVRDGGFCLFDDAAGGLLKRSLDAVARQLPHTASCIARDLYEQAASFGKDWSFAIVPTCLQCNCECACGERHIRTTQEAPTPPPRCVVAQHFSLPG